MPVTTGRQYYEAAHFDMMCVLAGSTVATWEEWSVDGLSNLLARLSLGAMHG